MEMYHIGAHERVCAIVSWRWTSVKPKIENDRIEGQQGNLLAKRTYFVSMSGGYCVL